jgi:hypothetical protein
MHEVGLARLSDLTLVDLGAVDVRLLDHVKVGVRVILGNPIEDVVEP